LLLIDYLRGPDSTGFAAIRKTGEAIICKAAVNPIDLFDFPKFKTGLTSFPSQAFMGHNRAATKGLVNNINAHPYEVDHIVGAHNGTLDQSCWNELETKLGEKYGTDSHALIACIAKFGIEETVPLLRGAWSLVWFDRSNMTLNFLRNKERPMYFSYDKEFRKVFWASEWPMIDVATKLSTGTPGGYELYADDKGYKFFPTNVDWWYRFDLKAIADADTDKPKPYVKELKGKEPAVVASYVSTHDPFNRTNVRNLHGTTSMTTSHGTSATLGKPTKDPLFTTLEGDEENPFAGVLEKEEFDSIAAYGCNWCKSPISYSDPGIIIWERDRTCLCAECAGGSNKPTRLYLPNIEQLL
jgi:predicted glutamine amidotransferase